MYEQQSLLTADLDEIIDATGHNDAQPQEQAQEAPAVKYYPIDEETARRAHEMMSMRDYPAGRATNEYRASVDKAAALVDRCKAATSPYYHGKLDALLDRYARRPVDERLQLQRRKLSQYPCFRRLQLPSEEKAAPERPRGQLVAGVQRDRGHLAQNQNRRLRPRRSGRPPRP